MFSSALPQYGRTEVARAEKDAARALAYAAKVIDLCSAPLARDAMMLFAPTIGAAIDLRHAVATLLRPACSIRGEIDLRERPCTGRPFNFFVQVKIGRMPP